MLHFEAFSIQRYPGKVSWLLISAVLSHTLEATNIAKYVMLDDSE